MRLINARNGMDGEVPVHSHFHNTLRFSTEAVSHIVCMDDFYRTVGMTNLICEDYIQDVQQIWMNAAQCEYINTLCKKNARKSKKYDHLSDRLLETAVAMDWLSYSPVSVPYVPANEIWVWSTESYRTAMDEYRTWRNNNPRKDT